MAVSWSSNRGARRALWSVLQLSMVVTGSAFLLALAPSVALAHGGDSGPQLPNEARAATPDGAKAKEILARIGKSAAESAIVKESLGKGFRALQRADGANAAGDLDGARLLSRVALAHANNAEATLRAVDAEKKATDAGQKALELRDKLVRTRTLLAETQAQRGQVNAEIARADEDAKAHSEKARTKEDDRLQKGSKKSDGGDGKAPTKDGAKPPKTPSKKKGADQ